MRNRLRELFNSRESVLGPYVTLTDPSCVEIVGLAGFDLAVIELEHSSICLETLPNLFRAAGARELAVMVRVPSQDDILIRRVLDAGAEGILVPHVSTPDTVRELVKAVHYPPLGQRSMSSNARSTLYGAHGLSGARE